MDVGRVSAEQLTHFKGKTAALSGASAQRSGNWAGDPIESPNAANH